MKHHLNLFEDEHVYSKDVVGGIIAAFTILCSISVFTAIIALAGLVILGHR
jgi:hypothetical protein